MFINYSNHSSKNWSMEQLEAAFAYGDIIDISFLNVDPSWSADEIVKCARIEAEKILAYKPDAVMCQGEATLTYTLVGLLKNSGVKCLSACTARKARERVCNDGSVIKESVFVFEGFREYKDGWEGME